MITCDECGARRPRTGPCPECGAPPPDTYSQQRRGSSRAGSSLSGPSGPGASGARRPNGNSGANWGSPGASGARNRSAPGRGLGAGSSGASWRRNEGWDEEEAYTSPPPPTRSNPRNSSPGNSGARNRRSSPSYPGYGEDDYQEIAPDRALAPSRGDMLPLDPSMNAALPGAPLTEEEERALGIRRPVYIPATDEKRKRRLSSWRVISGVLSVMLVCVAGCGVVGFVGQKQIAKIFTGPLKTTLGHPSYNYTNVPVTPVATPGLAANFIKSAVTATGVDSSYNPIDITSHFTAGSDVVLVVRVQGVSDNTTHTVTVQWFLGDVPIQASRPNTSVTRTNWPVAGVNITFKLQYSEAGEGSARVYWDSPNDTSTSPNDPHLGQTIYFGVYPPNVTPTPPPPSTPAPTTTPNPSASPTGALAPPVAWREQD